MTTKTIYVANDGTEFESREDCERYERFANCFKGEMFCANGSPCSDARFAYLVIIRTDEQREQFIQTCLVKHVIHGGIDDVGVYVWTGTRWTKLPWLIANAISRDKRKYNVRLSAEGTTCGTIELTDSEADIVDFATNPSNWDNVSYESWSGFFEIELAEEVN